ncbi:MAG: hypothetical protein LBU97_01000 [Alistipes sp.]|nr:hypothetical protein [Alistipes sp.]
MFTVIYYVMLLVAVTIFLIATLLVYPFTVPLDRTRRAVHEISRGIALLFFRMGPGWRTKVEGL